MIIFMNNQLCSPFLPSLLLIAGNYYKKCISNDVYLKNVYLMMLSFTPNVLTRKTLRNPLLLGIPDISGVNMLNFFGCMNFNWGAGIFLSCMKTRFTQEFPACPPKKIYWSLLLLKQKASTSVPSPCYGTRVTTVHSVCISEAKCPRSVLRVHTNLSYQKVS